MEILQPYNNNTLQLISDVVEYQFNSDDLISSSIKLSVFSDIGSYLDGEDLQQDIDFYVKDNDLFIKPNEYLDRNGFSEANYNLQYDFLNRLDTNNFIISEISPSRKEIRLNVVGSEVDDNSRDIIVEFMRDANRDIIISDYGSRDLSGNVESYIFHAEYQNFES